MTTEDTSVSAADAVKSLVRVAIANALAESLVSGIGELEEEGKPITQVQQIHLAKMAIMAYHTTLVAIEISIDTEYQLRRLKQEHGIPRDA